MQRRKKKTLLFLWIFSLSPSQKCLYSLSSPILLTLSIYMCVLSISLFYAIIVKNPKSARKKKETIICWQCPGLVSVWLDDALLHGVWTTRFGASYVIRCGGARSFAFFSFFSLSFVPFLFFFHIIIDFAFSSSLWGLDLNYDSLTTTIITKAQANNLKRNQKLINPSWCES